MRQACNLSTQEVEAGGLVVQGLPLLHEEFVASPQSRLHETLSQSQMDRMVKDGGR